MRETLAVDDKADKHLLRSLGMADIDMPQKAGAGGLIIGRNAPAAGIAQDGAARLLGAGRLDAAVLHGDDVVRSLFKKTRLDAGLPHGDGELGLVAVALARRRGRQGDERQVLPADAVQGVRHALRLNAALRRIAQVPEIAAAAALGIRTEPGAAVRRGREDTLDAAIGRVPADMRDAQVVFLVRRGVRHEDGAAVHPADAEALAREAGDGGAVNFVLFQHMIPLFRFAEWAGRVPTALCRGGACPSRLCATGSYKLTLQW